MAGQAEWSSFKIQLPGKDLLEPVRNVLETLLVFLEVLKAILETIKAFLIDFPNPIAALVKALIALITTFFEALNRTGIYAWFDVPNPSVDPNFYRFQGGYPAFVNRFKGSLLDTRDPGRPQPISGATSSGFVCIIADAQGPIELIRLIKILLRFFSKDLTSPVYPPPSNVKIAAGGDAKTPILNLARMFKVPVNGVLLQWNLGGNQTSPDPGFRDLAGMVGAEFIPPNWLIEKSEVPVTGLIPASSLLSTGVAGQVVIDVETDHEIRGQPSKRAKQTQRLVDVHGDPIIRFEKVIKIETGTGLLSILGEMGVMKYFDDDVELDHTYYYRIRAYTGDLPVQDGIIQYSAPTQALDSKKWYAPLPNGVVMGRPSPVFRIRVPKIPSDFDVIENLTRLFQTAFSLNFHLDAIDASFDSDDNPTSDTTSVAQIGRGTLQSQANVLSQFTADPFVGRVVKTSNKLTSKFFPPEDPVTGLPEDPPWNEPMVRHSARRLAGIVGSALLEHGSPAITQFQQLMTGPYPRGVPQVDGLSSSNNVSEMCFALTALNAENRVDQTVYDTYGRAFVDANTRKNVLQVVRFIKSFTLGGVPPDWIQISILRDLIPWSGQLLYDILAKIQALLDAFKSVLDEIRNFIDMLVRKIEVLEKFIQFLISILDFILSLSAGFYILKLPETDGDAFAWMEAVDSATGTKPASGPGGYSCGVAFAYVAVNVKAFAAAFDMIF